MNVYQLKQHIKQNFFDYHQLIAALSGYAQPRRKIFDWLKTGELIRVKKGLYVFGDKVGHTSYSLPVLSNLIYGPSAVSLEYALSYYGLIPERVMTVTCITNRRNKAFKTPIGDFSYRYLNPKKYPIGICISLLSDGHQFLIATPEKALCDYLTLVAKDLEFNSLDDVVNFIEYDMRFDSEIMLQLDEEQLKNIGNIYNNKNLSTFLMYLQQWKVNQGAHHE